jgi:hypothetical protein
MKNYKVTTTTDNGSPTETVVQMTEFGDPCAKCGLNPSTQEVTIMVEHSGGTAFWCDECAKGPQWTTTPPTEPGHYWKRRYVRIDHSDSPRPYVSRVFIRDDELWDEIGALPTEPEDHYEWYPVRIKEPPR